MALVILYVPVPSMKEADRIARRLLQRRLIACANMFPMRSIYRWKQKMVAGKEVALFLKTTAARRRLVEKEVLAIHPYDVPGIITLSATANAMYESWLRAQLR